MQANRKGLLDGYLVLELGTRVASGICGSLLADLGAEVLVVEPARPPRAGKWRNRAAVVVGKRSVASDDESCARDDALLDLADVVLLSTDVDPDSVAVWDRPRPRGQIVCDVTAFGHTGPLAGLGGSETLVDAYAGATETTGDPASLPTTIGAPLLEMETAVYAASAIIAARRVVRRHGIGQRLDIAVYDVGVNALATFLPFAALGRPAGRDGNHHPMLPCWNSYPARDGAVVVCAPTNDQWRRLCEAMGRPELAADPRFATTSGRLDHNAEIDAMVAAWSAGLTVAECVAILGERVIPSGPVVSLADLPREPNLVHRGLIEELEDPETGAAVRVMPSPLRLGGRRAALPARDRDGTERARALRRVRPVGERVTGDLACDARPLEGVRVIEVGMNTVAPLAARQLGALGADVIKVEPPTGDTNRQTPPLREDGESYVYAISNTDKRGIVLDLKRESERQVLLDLLASADVLLENLKPGSLTRLGLGPEAMSERFPALIYCSVNGFGHDSAYPGRPALDTVIQAMSGVMAATLVDGVATKSGISLADQLGGQMGLLAVLAALERKERTGAGAVIDLAMQDCAAWATQMLWNGAPGSAAEVRILAAADGCVAVEGSEAAMSEALGAPAESLSRADVVHALAGGRDCAAAPVLTVREILEHPQTRERGLLIERETSEGDAWLVLESPLRLRSTPAEVRRVMSRLGVLDPALADELAAETTA